MFNIKAVFDQVYRYVVFLLSLFIEDRDRRDRYDRDRDRDRRRDDDRYRDRDRDKDRDRDDTRNADTRDEIGDSRKEIKDKEKEVEAIKVREVAVPLNVATINVLVDTCISSHITYWCKEIMVYKFGPFCEDCLSVRHKCCSLTYTNSFHRFLWCYGL